MNNKRNYELKCLLDILEAVVNEDKIPEWQQEPDWGKLFKLADYHHVANTVYAPILSMENRWLARWKSSFEERYHYSVVMRDRYKDAEAIVVKAIEKAKIHCMELEESVLTGCYARKENRYPMPITFLIEHGKIEILRKVMKQLDFEERPAKDQKTASEEHCFSKSGGVMFVFYETLIFTGKKINRYFSLSPKSFQKKKGYQYIHVQNVNDFYLYYIAWLAERYAKGDIELRNIMDLWQYYLLCYEKIDWTEVNKELERLELGEFGRLIVKLSAIWFGGMNDFEDDADMLLAMKIYIASKGTRAREENQKLLTLVKEVADVYARDLKRERRREKLERWFPDRVYMETIYPALETRGRLLPFYWIARLSNSQWRKTRYFVLRNWNFMRNNLKKREEQIKEKLSFIAEIKEKFKKNKEDGNNS